MFKKKKRRSRAFKETSQVINLDEARKKRKQKRELIAGKKYKAKKLKTKITQRQAGQKVRRRMVCFCVFVAVAFILGASVFSIVSLKIAEAKTIQEQESLLAEKSRLEKTLSQVNEPEYIEQQARKQLRMIKPGEILYILPGDSTDNTTSDGVSNSQENE